MIAVMFPEQNTIMARDQVEYKALIGFSGQIPNNDMGGHEFVACYKLSDAEIEKLLQTRVIWLRFLTYGGSLQPHLPSVDNPFHPEEHTR